MFYRFSYLVVKFVVYTLIFFFHVFIHSYMQHLLSSCLIVEHAVCSLKGIPRRFKMSNIKSVLI
jgi:hypothetical protein